ncbi:hypothetical protein GUJ93_ZPchr0048g33359 [Zizania palustris]|uniref:Uncharacterized protein n=1 Tax=Zizania palustris TaxID=103762 RepID=A0A8J5UV35_ZIZPA|nr:hypothetical protein GUJ93_ZPchr0048g33359 [Zizania palustris]
MEQGIDDPGEGGGRGDQRGARGGGQRPTVGRRCGHTRVEMVSMRWFTGLRAEMWRQLTRRGSKEGAEATTMLDVARGWPKAVVPQRGWAEASCGG